MVFQAVSLASCVLMQAELCNVSGSNEVSCCAGYDLPLLNAGEGCSAEGGCASCPYMKMNSLAALRGVCDKVGSPAGEALLAPFQPRAYKETVGGRTMAQVRP